MSPVEKVELEWSYSPLNYFEEPINLVIDQIPISITQGKALAKIPPEQFEENTSLEVELQNFIESRFQAVQILHHKNYELAAPSRTDIKEDGSKHHYLQIHDVVCAMTVDSIDLVVKDKDENIKSDSKKERLEKQKRYADLLQKHIDSDSTLNKMTSSYGMSVKDPKNEFVHLYEIRDALTTKFGSKKSAIRELNITKGQWDEIGVLANTLPLNQGRHRGQVLTELRDANLSELKQGRESIANLIEKYLEYLGK